MRNGTNLTPPWPPPENLLSLDNFSGATTPWWVLVVTDCGEVRVHKPVDRTIEISTVNDKPDRLLEALLVATKSWNGLSSVSGPFRDC